MAITPVANGQIAYASQYNALITALQDEGVGHAHTGEADGGAPVSHSDLTDGAIASLSNSHSHAELDAHVESALGQHQLNASASVVGSIGSQFVLQAGLGTTDTTIGFPDWITCTKAVVFPVPFSSIVAVFVAATDGTRSAGPANVTVTGFTAHLESGTQYAAFPVTFYWLAIGTLVV
jgi:hypothetical protein